MTQPPQNLDAAADSAPATYGADLDRSLTLTGNVLITLSSISPASSVFILGGAALSAFGTGVFWAFGIAGVVSILIAFCYAELAAAYPVTGGDYALVSRALGPAFGVASFFLNLISLPLIIAVFALGVADYLGIAIGGLSTLQTGLVVVVLSTITACFNIRANAWVTGVFLFIEMASLILLAALGVIHLERPITALFDAQALTEDGSLAPLAISGLMIAVSQGIFAYNGYGGAVYFAEETKDPTRAVAKAVIFSAAITIAFEIIPLSAIILGAESLPALFGAELPVEDFLEARSGHIVSVIVLLAVAFAIINAIIAITLQAGRLLYSAARDRALPDAIAAPLRKISTSSQVPVKATIVMGVIAFGACFVPLDTLLTATGCTLIFSYLFIALAALTHRRSGKTFAGYRMPWWPLPPVVALIALVGVFVVSFGDADQRFSLGIATAFVLAGFAYYWFYLKPRAGTHLVLLEANVGVSTPLDQQKGPLDQPVDGSGR